MDFKIQTEFNQLYNDIIANLDHEIVRRCQIFFFDLNPLVPKEKSSDNLKFDIEVNKDKNEVLNFNK